LARFAKIVAALAVVAFAGFWLATAPKKLDPAIAAALPAGDAGRGEIVFTAAGCAACHTAPGAPPSDPPILSGGEKFPSDFGTFFAPNISSDPVAGIGTWSDADIALALTEGVSPDGRHYFPAFPYTAYGLARPDDIADLIAYLRRLPADATPSQPHDVAFPFSIRRNLGGWKRLFARTAFVATGPLDPAATRGRYLVEALAHCGECHSPRNRLGGIVTRRWLAGARLAGNDGRTPNITPARLQWSAADIAEYLKSGFTPEFDTAGGKMVDVIDKTSRLPQADRDAIAAYLKAVLPAE